MENWHSFHSQGSWKPMKNEEFQEEDIWGVLKERKDSDSRELNLAKPSSFISKHPKSASRIIQKSHKSSPSKIIQQSAPVNIPDWSKIYGTNSKGSYSSLGTDPGDGDDHGFARSSWESEDEDEDDDEGDVIPPHESIARRLARSQISSFSVCEGAGRTLKGRDLSRVRNAVLIKTGFLESPSNH